MCKKLITIILVIALICSVGFSIYLAFFEGDSMLWRSYLQDPEEIRIMETGVILAHKNFREGEDLSFDYDFDNEEYPVLREKYDIEATAGNGSEFERARNLMNEYSGRLTHKCDIRIEPEQMNAIYLLDYSLDNKDHGIYCRAKAQILNEMCLALGICSRKVWINPISVYDTDCHVVNEVWDSHYGKWIMLDITNNVYWIDKDGTPLSVLEIRDQLAENEFCTPVTPGDDLSAPEKLLDKNMGNYLYIAKNMVYMYYLDRYTVGESDTIYMLMPENLDKDFEVLISRASVDAAP